MSGAVAKTCGCHWSGRLRNRCDEAESLWQELIEARDKLRAVEDSGSRVGLKPAIDEFAARRDAYSEHVEGAA